MPAQSATNGTGAQLLTETYGVGPFHGGGGGGSGSGYNAGFDQGQSQAAGGWDNSGWDNKSGVTAASECLATPMSASPS